MGDQEAQHRKHAHCDPDIPQNLVDVIDILRMFPVVFFVQLVDLRVQGTDTITDLRELSCRPLTIFTAISLVLVKQCASGEHQGAPSANGSWSTGVRGVPSRATMRRLDGWKIT